MCPSCCSVPLVWSVHRISKSNSSENDGQAPFGLTVHVTVMFSCTPYISLYTLPRCSAGERGEGRVACHYWRRRELGHVAGCSRCLHEDGAAEEGRGAVRRRWWRWRWFGWHGIKVVFSRDGVRLLEGSKSVEAHRSLHSIAGAPGDRMFQTQHIGDKRSRPWGWRCCWRGAFEMCQKRGVVR